MKTRTIYVATRRLRLSDGELDVPLRGFESSKAAEQYIAALPAVSEDALQKLGAHVHHWIRMLEVESA